MNLSRFSIHRPVFTTMVMLIVIILGGVALSRLPIDLMPEITYPVLSVVTNYDNAGPEEIEELVTRPIEQALSAVPGVEKITSNSSESSSVVRVSFTWGTNLEEAANDIRDRLDRIIGSLPEDVSRPTLRKFDLSQFPILILGVTSELDPVELRKVIDEQVKYRIERQPGVAALDIRGGLEREIHINVLADKVKALGLSFNLIVNQLKTQNVTLPTGTVRKGDYDLVVRTEGKFKNLNELRNTVIAFREGVPIELKEIAEVEKSHKTLTRIIRINGKPGIRLTVQKQSGANTVAVAKEVLKELKLIDEDFKQFRIIPLVNTADYIQRSISNVTVAAMMGGTFAICILLFFLGNLRSTAIIATAIPISIIATFLLIYFSGFTLNLMTLGGLAVGVGMIVDNSIVVLENIYRIKKQGATAMQAAILGSEEVTSAIIASTLTTLVIFLPLIFVRGMSGIMFKQLAFVIGFSLLCSLFVALTLIPMLASRILGKPHEKFRELKFRKRLDKILFTTETFLTTMEDGYVRILSWSLNNKKRTFLIILSLFAISLGLIPLIGVEFMPSADEGEVRVYAEMDVGTHLDITNEKFRQIEAIAKKEVPEAQNMVSRLGSSSWHAGGSHQGRLQIALKPMSQRLSSSEEIAASLRKKMSQIPGMSIRTRAGQGLFVFRIVSGTGDEKIQIDVRGFDLETANSLAKEIQKRIEDIPGITDILLSREAGKPEERILINRDRAADMKLSVSDIATTLQTVLSGAYSGKYREQGNEYNILLKVKNAEQMSLHDILDLTVVNAEGRSVVMKNVVRIEPGSAPIEIVRKDQERVVTISVNIGDRDMGSILGDIRQTIASIPVPRDFSIVFSGDYEAQEKAFRELLLAVILSLILIYMVMASLYESLRDPFLVMFSVPLAVIGVSLVLFLTKTTFNVQSFIGCIMLGGIVVNNAILLVDYINLLRERDKMSLQEAILEAGKRRLRPILMTALTTILGMLPLSLSLVEGSETQASLARVVIGGLASSTLITLVFVPLLYALFERWFPKRYSTETHISQPEA